MKRIIASGLLMVAVLIGGVACKKAPTPKPAHTNYQGQRTTIGDGSWIVGDELAPGLWEPASDITKMANCAWFVSPAAEPSPYATTTMEPSFRTQLDAMVLVELHRGETFTTSGCGQWRMI